MRALKIAVIVMAGLIVLGTAGLVTVIVRRSTTTAAVPPMPPPPPISLKLEEPEGTRIAGIAALRDRLAVQLQGGGPDRIVLIDPLTGTVIGRIVLAR